jgi:hypothetical protein
MALNSKALYGLLREGLGPAFEGAGFSPLKERGLVAFSRPQGVDSLVCWFQADRHGWEDLWGSSFTLEFQLGPEATPGAGNMLKRRRYSRLLAPGAREELRAINNTVIASLPGTEQGATVSISDDSGEDIVVIGVVTTRVPYHADDDIWMRYRSADHVDLWVQFLAQHVGAVADRMGTELA